MALAALAVRRWERWNSVEVWLGGDGAVAVRFMAGWVLNGAVG